MKLLKYKEHPNPAIIIQEDSISLQLKNVHQQEIGQIVKACETDRLRKLGWLSQ